MAHDRIRKGEELSMKVLLTGGAGFIGRHTAHLFKTLGGMEVVVLDNLTTGAADTVLDWRMEYGDYGDKPFIEKLMKNEAFDAIVHCGGNCDIDEGQNNPKSLYMNNVSAMVTLLSCAAKYGIKYIVYSSSSTVYGTPQYIPVDEKHPISPENTYASTKYAGELVVRDFARVYGMYYCIFRYFNVSGSSHDGLLGETGVHIRRIVPAVIRTEFEKDYQLTVFGNDYETRDGTCLRDYIHVDDIAMANYLGLKYIAENNCSDLFNLGSETGNTVLELIHEFEKVVDHKVQYQIGARRGYEPGALVASNEKAKAILHWEPKSSTLFQILQDELNWKRKMQQVTKP